MPSEPALEKGLFGLLVLAGVIGIGYGFSCLVDLVQNWALVNASIGPNDKLNDMPRGTSMYDGTVLHSAAFKR